MRALFNFDPFSFEIPIYSKSSYKTNDKSTFLENKPLGAPQGGACGGLWAPRLAQGINCIILSLFIHKNMFQAEIRCGLGEGAWFIVFQVKIYLYIQTKNVVIHCTSGKVASNIGILETVFCLVNGSLEDIENKMEG